MEVEGLKLPNLSYNSCQKPHEIHVSFSMICLIVNNSSLLSMRLRQELKQFKSRSSSMSIPSQDLQTKLHVYKYHNLGSERVRTCN